MILAVLEAHCGVKVSAGSFSTIARAADSASSRPQKRVASREHPLDIGYQP